VHPQLATNIIRWVFGSFAGKYSFSFAPTNSIHPISAARNSAYQNHFLQTTADRWVMFDNDIEPPADLIDAILNMPEECDIAIFPYWVFDNLKPMVCAGEWTNGQMVTHDFASVDWHEIGAGGTGAMCIRRRVFDKVPMPPFKIIYDSEVGQKMSEDIYFTSNAKEAGLRLFTHTGYICEHHRTIGVAEVNAGMVSILRKAFDIVREQYGDKGVKVPDLNTILGIQIKHNIWKTDDLGNWTCPNCHQIWANGEVERCQCK